LIFKDFLSATGFGTTTNEGNRFQHRRSASNPC
jgi:hypothetical protein